MPVPELEIQQSKFYKQQTRILKGERSNHNLSLFWAICHVVIHFIDVVTDYMLVGDYFANGHWASAISMIFVHLFVAFTQIFFDYFNNYRLRYFVLDLLDMRILYPDFYDYMKVWPTMRGKRWARKDFRGATSFTYFPAVFPSLIIQAHVMIIDTEKITWIQVFSIVFTCFHCVIEILHHFRYVSVHREIWAYQLLKAFINTALRTLLAASLLPVFKLYSWLWVAGSFAGALATHFIFLVISARRKRDDPLKTVSAHTVYALYVSCLMLFASFPYAPNHSIEDWWLGYLLSDTKINLENGLLVAIVVNLWKDRDSLYYSGVFFCGACLIGNFVFLKFLDGHVRDQLARRGIYSSQLIVRLWTYFGRHYKGPPGSPGPAGAEMGVINRA